MHRTPPRPHLFTDTAIRRKIFLEYNRDGAVITKELTGAALDSTSVDILNDPDTKACVVVKFSPEDLDNAPLVYRYAIKKFLITDYDPQERVVEVRLEPWVTSRPAAYQRGKPSPKVFSHGHITVFARVTVRLITVRNDKRAPYEISSSAKLDQLTGIITL